MQGELGDCYLLGAMSNVSIHPSNIVEQLFVSSEDFNVTGRVVVRFFEDATWVEVVIDTLIPCFKDTRKPIFARNKLSCELWAMFLEKAYAKFAGSYEKLNSGSVAESLVELSGGVSQKILLTEDASKAAAKDGSLWRRLARYLKFNYLLGCSNSVAGAKAENDSDTKDGILVNHAYSILYCKEVGKLQLLKLRNPWGFAEWDGDWSDKSEKWEENPAVLSALQSDPKAKFTREPDGTFWIDFKNFLSHYTKIYICRVFGPDFKQYLIRGEWRGKTAAGSHKTMLDRDGAGDEASASSRKKGWVRRSNGDPAWFNNPQYMVKCKKSTDLFISLMQKDRRYTGSTHNHSIRFVVIEKPRNYATRVWELDPSETLADSTKASFSNIFPQREVTKGSIKIDPRHIYFIIPFTEQQDISQEYVVRIFCKDALELQQVPETHLHRFTGKFAIGENEKDKTKGDTAGGPLIDKGGKSNPRWCQNPQYYITLPHDRTRPTNIKVVVRRLGETKKKKLPMIALVVCKPTVALADRKLRRKKQAHSRLALISDEPLTRTVVHPAGAPPPRTEIGRKLILTRDEWATLSLFEDEMVSCTFLKDVSPEFAEHGLIVSPMLNKNDAQCRFHLEMHSDLDIRVQELEDSTMQSVWGYWGSSTSGGCHINEVQWKKNPVYMLRLLGNRGDRAKVKVTLSRAEDRWKKICRADPVGSMIGFYITPLDFDSTEITHETGVTYQTDFVPMHDVSTPTGFYLEVLPEHKYYGIVPCTYDAGKAGPFSISVSVTEGSDLMSSDIAFVLKKITLQKKKSRR